MSNTCSQNYFNETSKIQLFVTHKVYKRYAVIPVYSLSFVFYLFIIPVLSVCHSCSAGFSFPSRRWMLISQTSLETFSVTPGQSTRECGPCALRGPPSLWPWDYWRPRSPTRGPGSCFSLGGHAPRLVHVLQHGG